MPIVIFHKTVYCTNGSNELFIRHAWTPIAYIFFTCFCPDSFFLPFLHNTCLCHLHLHIYTRSIKYIYIHIYIQPAVQWNFHCLKLSCVTYVISNNYVLYRLNFHSICWSIFIKHLLILVTLLHKNIINRIQILERLFFTWK